VFSSFKKLEAERGPASEREREAPNSAAESPRGSQRPGAGSGARRTPPTPPRGSWAATGPATRAQRLMPPPRGAWR
jgi:hypothetical protein